MKDNEARLDLACAVPRRAVLRLRLRVALLRRGHLRLRARLELGKHEIAVASATLAVVRQRLSFVSGRVLAQCGGARAAAGRGACVGDEAAARVAARGAAAPPRLYHASAVLAATLDRSALARALRRFGDAALSRLHRAQARRRALDARVKIRKRELRELGTQVALHLRLRVGQLLPEVRLDATELRQALELLRSRVLRRTGGTLRKERAVAKALTKPNELAQLLLLLLRPYVHLGLEPLELLLHL